MNKIIFASNNQGKITEIKQMFQQINPELQVYSLVEMNITEEIAEPGVTFHQNALIKAQYIAKKYPSDIILADDSGLEVEALNGEPGVYSARYASESSLYQTDKNKANNEKLLEQLRGITNRKANFKTVLCLIIPKLDPLFVSGKVEGVILENYSGTKGFGYDPIFSHNGTTSFAELDLVDKNQISHRANALRKLKNHEIWKEIK